MVQICSKFGCLNRKRNGLVRWTISEQINRPTPRKTKVEVQKTWYEKIEVEKWSGKKKDRWHDMAGIAGIANEFLSDSQRWWSHFLFRCPHLVWTKITNWSAWKGTHSTNVGMSNSSGISNSWHQLNSQAKLHHQHKFPDLPTPQKISWPGAVPELQDVPLPLRTGLTPGPGLTSGTITKSARTEGAEAFFVPAWTVSNCIIANKL